MAKIIIFYFLIGLIFFLFFMFRFYLTSEELYGHRKIDNFSVKVSILSMIIWPLVVLFAIFIYTLPSLLNFAGWIYEQIKGSNKSVK